jgi:hypothetical protein
MDLTMKHNTYIMEHPSTPTDTFQQFPMPVNPLTGPEQLEFTSWHKRKELWREKCASAFLFLQGVLHSTLWMEIEINCGDISDIENKQTITKIWKYLEDTYRVPTLFQVQNNSDMIDAIPSFDRWQEAEHHLSTFHSLCQEREFWGLRYILDEHKKILWLSKRLTDSEFKQVKSVINSECIKGDPQWNIQRSRVTSLLLQLRNEQISQVISPSAYIANIPTYVEEPQVMRAYTNTSIKKSDMICYNCGRMGHRALDCTLPKKETFTRPPPFDHNSRLNQRAYVPPPPIPPRTPQFKGQTNSYRSNNVQLLRRHLITKVMVLINRHIIIKLLLREELLLWLQLICLMMN